MLDRTRWATADSRFADASLISAASGGGEKIKPDTMMRAAISTLRRQSRRGGRSAHVNKIINTKIAQSSHWKK